MHAVRSSARTSKIRMLRLPSDQAMAQRTLNLLGASLALLLAAGACWAMRVPTNNEEPRGVALRTPPNATDPRLASELIIPGALTPENDSRQALARVESRNSAVPLTETELEAIYRDATVRELDRRHATLWGKILNAALGEAYHLRVEGKYERLGPSELAARTKDSSTPERGQTYTLSFGLEDGAVERGRIEFKLLDRPATAALERERLFLSAKREELRTTK
jgi:hypothetical protein